MNKWFKFHIDLFNSELKLGLDLTDKDYKDIQDFVLGNKELNGLMYDLIKIQLYNRKGLSLGKNYIITSESVIIENGYAKVDYNGLKEWVLWELDENECTCGELNYQDLADDIIHDKLTDEELIKLCNEFGYDVWKKED